MNNFYDILPGLKTYIAAAGLVGLAVYQLSQNDLLNAFQSFMAALAVFGVRNAIARNDSLVLASHQELLCQLEHHEESLRQLKHNQLVD